MHHGAPWFPAQMGPLENSATVRRLPVCFSWGARPDDTTAERQHRVTGLEFLGDAGFADRSLLDETGKSIAEGWSQKSKAVIIGWKETTQVQPEDSWENAEFQTRARGRLNFRKKSRTIRSQPTSPETRAANMSIVS